METTFTQEQIKEKIDFFIKELREYWTKNLLPEEHSFLPIMECYLQKMIADNFKFFWIISFEEHHADDHIKKLNNLISFSAFDFCTDIEDIRFKMNFTCKEFYVEILVPNSNQRKEISFKLKPAFINQYFNDFQEINNYILKECKKMSFNHKIQFMLDSKCMKNFLNVQTESKIEQTNLPTEEKKKGLDFKKNILGLSKK